MGGKWTTFRKMGEETVNLIIKDKDNIIPFYDFSTTQNFKIVGSYSKCEVKDKLALPDDQLQE